MGLESLYKGRGGGIEGLDAQFKTRMERAIAALPPQLAGQITIISAYRSVAHQQELWDKAVKKYGSEAAARKWVAPPGKSNHGKGAAMDLQFASEAARKWIHANAGRFGLAFPMSHEPWHIEPLGFREGNATSIQNSAGHADPEAYTDGQGIPEVNNQSLETQFMRVADMLMGGASQYEMPDVQDAANEADENVRYRSKR